MKIRQAVVTSAAETLDGRQGLGLVLCSRSLPEEIRQKAREFEHSSGSTSQAIYCLTIVEASGDRWIVMNRAVPDIEYTRRTSHVSHTVAFREEELKQFFHTRISAIPSAFEFMRNFEWLSSWKDELNWLEDDADLDEFRTKAFDANLFNVSNPLDPKYLLAFVHSDTGSKPKRLAWRFGEGNSEEMLDTFHQAWLCLDPWQGTRKYRDLLGEPEVSMLASWQCTFSTNLLHGRPDPYVWVALSPEFPELASRELIEPLAWKEMLPEEIKDKIDRPFGNLLVERCVQGPEPWAKKQLQEIIADFERRYRENLGDVAVTEKNKFTELIKSLHTDIKNNEDLVRDYIRKGIGRSAKEAIETHLSGIRAEIHKCETDAQNNHTELTKSFLDKVTPLKLLLNANKEPNAIDVESTTETSIFKELHIDFNEASEKFKQAYHQYYSLWMEEQYQLKTQELAINVDNFTIKQAASDKEIGDLRSEISRKRDSIDSCQKTIADLKTRIPNPKKRKQMGWEMYSLISVSFIALGLATIIGINYKNINPSDPTSTPKSTSNEEPSMAALGRDNKNQRQRIEEQDATIEKQKSSLSSAKNEKEKLTEEIDKLKEERDKITGERNKFDDDLRNNDNVIADLKAKIEEMGQKLTALESANQAKKTNGNPTVVQPSGNQKGPPPAPPAPNTSSSDEKSRGSKADNSSREN
jgi:peptidoglycan hydrolase CwlO-like protein